MIINGASENLVGTNADGVADADEGNTIAFNGAAGVFVVGDASRRNAVRGNAIHSNIELGIDLGSDGVTPNDLLDADLGPNGFQNFPALTRVLAGATTRVLGVLHGTARMTFTIDVYANQSADPSGHGEGERPLGSFDVTTNILGIAFFDVTLPVSTAAGEMITATATDSRGNTSEFGRGTVARLWLDMDIGLREFRNEFKRDDDRNRGDGSDPIDEGKVAVLTAGDFDALSVDTPDLPITQFGDDELSTGVNPVDVALKDMDDDGDVDLLLGFSLAETETRRSAFGPSF